MKTNVLPPRPLTHEGAPAARINAKQELRRTVLATMLFEENFYESGEAVADRLTKLVAACKPEDVAAVAVEARSKMHLRHVPLKLCVELARKGSLKAETLATVIQRADELTEFLSLYQQGREGTKKLNKLSHQVKKGLALAFGKFNEYALAKYNRDGAVKLRDALFLCHAKPKDAEQDALWKRLAADQLATPDTWEVELSASKDKKASWERLLADNKLGPMALLRNLRNMTQASVPEMAVRSALASCKPDRVLPFRFIAAARAVPSLEDAIELCMFRCLDGAEKLPGKTALVIDTSPSMWQANISAKSEMTRFEAAAALAILAREVCEYVAVYAFNQRGYEVPPRRGFALRDALATTKSGYSCGGLGVQLANKGGYDRIIVLTDGQWHIMGASGQLSEGKPQAVSPPPLTKLAYMVNVANQQNGIGYGAWNSIDGWSEAIIDYIRAAEMTAS